MWKMDDVDPEPEVPTLLYIGRRDRVTGTAIELTDCVSSLLQQIDPSYRPDTPTMVFLDLHVGRPCQPSRASLTVAGPIAWQ